MSTGDKAGNKIDELAGKVKEGTGSATGDDSLKAEGQAQQSGAHLKQAGEKVKDALRDVVKGDDRPAT